MSLLQLCVCECAVILESCSALLVGASCVISSRLARLQIGKSSLRCITALCLPAAATAPQAETLIFYSPRGKISAGRSRDRSFSSPPLHFLEEFTPGVGDSSSTALGGTVAVVSPALSRPSSANESAAGSAGREEGRGLLRPCCPSPASSPYYPPSPFQGKMESCFRLLHHQRPQCLPRKRPRLRTWQHRAAIITVPVGIMTATVGESFPTGRKEGRPFWV